MYTEFLIIYAALGVLFLMLAAVIVLLIVLLKKDNSTYIPHNNYNPPVQTSAVPTGNIVFCKKCAAEFDSSQRVCPKCGTPR